MCTIGEDFQQGILLGDCVFKKPHGLKSTKLARKCDKCIRMDSRLSVARNKLDESREQFERRWAESYGYPFIPNEDAKSTEDGAEAVQEGMKETCLGEKGWIYSEKGEIKSSKGEVSNEVQPFQENIKASDEKEETSIIQDDPQLEELSVPQTHTGDNRGDYEAINLLFDLGSFVSVNYGEYLTAGSADCPHATALSPSSPNTVAETHQTTIKTPAKEDRALEGQAKKKPKKTPKSCLALPVSRTPKLEAVPETKKPQAPGKDDTKVSTKVSPSCSRVEDAYSECQTTGVDFETAPARS